MRQIDTLNQNVENKLANIEEILRANKRDLKERYGVKELGIFGSYLHGEQKATSDLDLLVEFEEPIGLFDFIRLENELTRVSLALIHQFLRYQDRFFIPYFNFNQVAFLNSQPLSH